MTFNKKIEFNNEKRLNEIVKVARKYKLGKLLISSSKRKSPDEFDESLDISNLRLAMEELGPAFIKLGQLLSTRPDFVGVEIAENLKKLRDDTPVTPFSEIKEVIESEIGVPLEEAYSEFDETPLGSASIGQVYRAKLKDTGEEVAVKVQKPNIYDFIASDVKILNVICKTADKYITKSRTYNLPAMAREFERSIFKELDYTEELRNMTKFRSNFRNVDYIKVPKTFTELSSSKIITMELIKGFEITELLDKSIEGIDNKKLANYGLDSYLKQILIDGFFHADPHPGNMFVTGEMKLCYIDFGMMGVLNEDFRTNFSQLILLLLDGNSNNLIKQMIYMGILSPEQDTEELRLDVDDLLNSYMGLELNEMHGIFDNLINVMIKHNVTLPREFVMIGRGVLLIEDTGNKLDPEFNLTRGLKKFAKKIAVQRFKPKHVINGGFNYLIEIEHLLKDLPDRVNSTFTKIEEGNIEVTLNHQGLNDLKNQISSSLIISAGLIGSCLIILADKGPKIFDISLIGLVTFIVCVILGLFIVLKHLIKD